jgi:hypothetical protein
MTRRLLGWTILLSAICFSLPTTVNAQVINTSPYAGMDRTKSKWPPFYRPDPSDAKYSQMLAEGWCKPTGWRAQQYYLSKMVDVNALPESTFRGKISEINPGLVKAVDEQGKSVTLIAHPDKSISYVQVQGRASREALQVGEFIRVVARVDGSGRIREPVAKVELVSPMKGELVTANRQQNIIGKIVKVDGTQLVFLSQGPKTQRLTMELADGAAVTAFFGDLSHAAVGDPFTAKGRMYNGAVGVGNFFFAEELELQLSTELKAMPKLTAAK